MFERIAETKRESCVDARDISRALDRSPSGEITLEIGVESNNPLAAYVDSRLGTLEDWTSDLLEAYQVDKTSWPRIVKSHDFQEAPYAQLNLVDLLRAGVSKRLGVDDENRYAIQRVSMTLALEQDLAVELYALGRAWYMPDSAPDYDIVYGAVFRRAG